MNYLKHYNKLIERAKNRIIENCVYSEKHHYIPKSIFNNPFSHSVLTACVVKSVNDKNNIIRLFPEEHIVAHLLLLKIFKENNKDCFIKMAFAANLLESRTNNNKEYGWLRRTYSKVLSEYRQGKPSGALGKKWSEARRKLGQPHLKGKTYKEILGESRSVDLKKLRSKKLKQTWELNYEKMKTGLINRKITWGNKISNSKLGISISDIHRKKLKEFFGDDKLNPKVDQTLYEFENVETGERIKARKIDMIKIYKCNRIYKLMKGETKICKGWKLIYEDV
jgi:hypothetical protein